MANACTHARTHIHTYTHNMIGHCSNLSLEKFISEAA